MSELFSSAANIFRDNLVIQLKEEINFLRKKLMNQKAVFFGKAVVRTPHVFMGQEVEEKQGKFIDFAKTSSQCYVLFSDEGRSNISLEYLSNIEFIEEIEI